MWTEPVVTVAAGSEPVTLAEAKAQCHVTSSDHDTALNLYIAAARDYIERYTGIRLVEQTVAFSRATFRARMVLPVAPVQSIASIEYQDADDAEQTLASSVYDFRGADTLRPIITLAEGQSWPTVYSDAEAVTVTAVVGYAEVPEALKHACLLLVAHWFHNREGVGGEKEAPFAVQALLENFRVFQ